MQPEHDRVIAVKLVRLCSVLGRTADSGSAPHGAAVRDYHRSRYNVSIDAI